MPLLTKLLFIAVGLGLLAVPIWIAHMQSRPPRRRQPQYRLEPIGRRRYNQLWIVDRDDPIDNPQER